MTADSVLAALELGPDAAGQALARQLAASIDDPEVPAYVKARCAHVLVEVLAELEWRGREPDALDELIARREKRMALRQNGHADGVQPQDNRGANDMENVAPQPQPAKRLRLFPPPNYGEGPPTVDRGPSGHRKPSRAGGFVPTVGRDLVSVNRGNTDLA